MTVDKNMTIDDIPDFTAVLCERKRAFDELWNGATQRDRLEAALFVLDVAYPPMPTAPRPPKERPTARENELNYRCEFHHIDSRALLDRLHAAAPAWEEYPTGTPAVPPVVRLPRSLATCAAVLLLALTMRVLSRVVRLCLNGNERSR